MCSKVYVKLVLYNIGIINNIFVYYQSYSNVSLIIADVARDHKS